MITFKTTYAEDCFINPAKITAIWPHPLSDGGKGSKILLDGGGEVVIIGEPKDVILKLNGKVE